MHYSPSNATACMKSLQNLTYSFRIVDINPPILTGNYHMNAFFQLLLNPAIISLLAGIGIGLATRLSFPRVLMNMLSGYLVFTIGFKGGACLGVANECTPPLIMLTAIGAAIGFIQPFIHHFLLKKTTSLDEQTAAVVASEYGSISIITFITAITFLTERSISYDTFMSATAGIMEIPALFSGLWIIKQAQKTPTSSLAQSILDICKAMIFCRQISFIFIGFFAGYLSNMYELDYLNNWVIWPFTIVLILFMVDIGIKIAKQRSAIHHFSAALLAFALYMPIINGCLGILIAYKTVDSLGTLVLFAVLLASASYIAVPAIMRSQAPQAQEAVYLPLALGITLPFNILIGIPIYYYISSYLLSVGI